MQKHLVVLFYFIVKRLQIRKSSREVLFNQALSMKLQVCFIVESRALYPEISCGRASSKISNAVGYCGRVVKKIGNAAEFPVGKFEIFSNAAGFAALNHLNAI